MRLTINLPQTKTVRLKGKMWQLPEVLPFWSGEYVRSQWHFYEVVDFRPPKQLEYYLSGADVGVYRAYQDYSENNPFLIVVPTKKAKKVQIWVEVENGT